MNTKVLFRVDGSPQIGLGHLVRCIALAHMLRNYFHITFFCKEIPEQIKKELSKNQFSLENLKEEKFFLSQIKPQEIVVCDGYSFNTNYQKQIKSRGAKLVCIDDLHDGQSYADLIINHAPGIKPVDYKAQYFTQYALGPEYALLRPVFLEQARKNRKIVKVEVVLICFGGSDYKNLTELTLRVIMDFTNFKRILVVTGTAYNNPDGLNNLVIRDNRIEHYHAVDEKKMLSLMIESDLAIVPASGILLEVIAAGCIPISGMYIENQKYLYSNYNKSSYFIDAKDFNAVDLRKAIEKSFKINFGKQKVVDGNSGKRLLNLFLQLELKEKIKLRKANNSDIKITFQWASNPKIRAFSFNKHIITKEEHALWFPSKLTENDCFYLIAEMDNLPVGSIRFDLIGIEVNISYLIDPEYQGKGLGQIILNKGIEFILDKAKENKIDFKKIVGFVMKTNIPSLKAFERLGFVKYEEDDKFKFEMSKS